MRFWSEIRDPIHGYIFITEAERDIIDTATFQRLRNIKQLAGAQLCYPGAEHSRFGHSLGVMHLAGILTTRLVDMGYLEDDTIQKVRLAALLHDIGHGPFSHIFEELTVRYLDKTQEDLSEWLVSRSEIKDQLSKNGFDPKGLSKLCVGKAKTIEKPYMNQIIAGPTDVDKMDFLIRDSHFTGVEYGHVDIYRLLYSMQVTDNLLTVNDAALYALEAFYIARYEMFKAVYYHRTVRSAEVMLTRAMDYANNELGLTSFTKPEEYILLDDIHVMDQLRTLRASRKRNLRLAAKLIEMLDRRELLKCAFETIIHVKDKFTASLLTRETVRREIEEEIAKRAGIGPDLVMVDTPAVPSLPYTPTQLDPLEVPIFSKDTGQIRKLSELSGLVSALKVYLDVVRIYTLPEYRRRVAKASQTVFGEGPISTKVSY